MNLLVFVLASFAAATLAPRPAGAACNLIPSAIQTFRSTLGSTNKPFAAPGDFVEVGVRPAVCDVASPGLQPAATDHDVTVVFTPHNKGQRRVVVLTASCAAAAGKLAACEATKGVGPGNVACVDTGATLALVTRLGVPHLSFRFPDTDAFLGAPNDRRTLAGPATIAVTNTNDPLPCDLASKPCSGATGVIACIDDYYSADGSCASTPHPTFTHFTALPVPNDYQADCFTTVPPCTALATEGRVAVDTAGNLLLPVNWQGVLVSQANVPVPRLLRAIIKSPLPFQNPPQVSLASFTPEGAPLPPIFEPQVDEDADPLVTGPNVLSLFGSADAPYTILRIARGLGACASGPNVGQKCVDSRDCGGDTCAPVCVGGTVPANTPCTKDGDCGSGGRCATLYGDFRPAVKNGGALVMPRTLPGLCQLAPHQACSSNAECGGVGNLCVTYAFEANNPVALESLTAGSEDVFVFTLNEAVDLVDRNGDGDTTDVVATLRNRETGESQPLGAPGGCGIPGTPEGRAVARLSETPFSFSAIATENDVMALVEDESVSNYCDVNGDGDRADLFLRVFELGTGELTAGPPRIVEPALEVNGRSLTVSGGRVFYRRPEARGAQQTTTRVSVAYDGSELYTTSDFPAMSDDGRFVTFVTQSNGVVPGETNNSFDLFVRDRLLGTVERVNVKSGGGDYISNGIATPAITPDGRFVAFIDGDSDLVPGDTNDRYDVFVRDRLLNTTERVSVQTGGGQSTSAQGAFVGTPRISSDGRFVAFMSDAPDLVPGDTNGVADIFVHDRQLVVTERVSVPTGGIGEANGECSDPAISADGRYVAFQSLANNLAPGAVNPPGFRDAFVFDRQTLVTERVHVNAAGDAGNGFVQGNLDLSADARFVAFRSTSSNLAPNSSGDEVYVRDRLTGTTEIVTLAVGGLPDSGQGPASLSMSSDGRYVAFEGWDSFGNNYVPGDTNGEFDVFLHDRQTHSTQLVSLTAGNMPVPSGGGLAPSLLPTVSSDGRFVAFLAKSDALVPGDTNGTNDVFVRGPDDTDTAAELTGDAVLDDTILESFDTGTSTFTSLCPAGAVAVTGGTAAFLRPEVGGTTTAGELPLCPLGTPATGGIDLNGDSDAADQVVHLWTGTGNVQNLSLAATAVALSSTHVAAIGAGGTLQTRAVSGGPWTDTGEPADAIQFCGNVVAFLQPVASHHVAKLYAPATTTLVATGQVAEQIVCNDTIAAFRTTEADQAANLNGPPDGDMLDDVLQTYDLSRPECMAVSHPANCVGNSNRAVTPCRFEVCDPRIPYRVNGDTVKFLTFEPDQGNQDLNGDNDSLDLVIEVYDVVADVVKVLGAVNDASPADPTQGGEVAGDGTVYVSSGRCIEYLATPSSCSTSADCGAGAFCDQGVCTKDHGACEVTGTCPPDPRCDCPPGIACDLSKGAVIASPDTDGDGVPDHVDNCVDVANATQDDADGDRVGDACDNATCGNNVVEYDEMCDGTSASNCTGSCQSNCTCTCANTITDPAAKVIVKTRNGSGQLVAKASLSPLAGYTDEPVTVRLDDLDSTPIVQARIGSIPPKGSTGTKFQHKVKADGLQKVELKLRVPGTYKLGVKAKRWFSAAAANGAAGDTRLTVTVGTQCFTRTATSKID
jgi:Tol biopolymer transport system component